MLAYVAVPMVGAASPLLAIPAITATNGAAGWAAIAIGQSVGAAGAVFVELAWSLTGPQRIAKADAQKRLRLFRLALLSKLSVFVLVAPIVLGATLMISKQHMTAAALSAIATTAIGLSPSWYFLGKNKPSIILSVETIPRVAGVAVSSALLVGGLPLWVNPAAMLFVALLTVAISYFVVSYNRPASSLTLIDLAETIRNQGMGLAGRAVSAVYIALPVTIVGIVAPAAVPQFAAVERLFRLTLVVLQAIPNAMQSWIGASTDNDRRRRSLRVLKINAAIGILAMVAFGTAVPFVAQLLFVGQIEIPQYLSWLAGVNILIVVCSRSTGGLVLVQFGRIGVIATSAAVGALIGISAIATLSRYFGPTGAVLGEMLAETGVLLVQLYFVVSILRHRGPDGHLGARRSKRVKYTESKGVGL